MSEGVLVRPLPDRASEFVLEDPVLASIVIDGRVTLRFGRIDVMLAGPFSLRVDGIDHWLDPGATGTLAPLLSSFPGSARWLWASPLGELTLVMMQGQRLAVPGAPVPSAWTVGATSHRDVLAR